MARKKRVKPTGGKYAAIDTKLVGDRFSTKFCAIILNESETGCALVFTSKDILDVDKCRIRIDKQDARVAEMVWAKSVDQEIFKAGFEFKD